MRRLIKNLKEPMSGFTHFLGTVLAVVGTVLLILRVVSPVKGWHIVTYSIFGFGLILLYTASTLYHWIPATPRAERFLRKFDHSAIFILIAATYTPVCLIPLRGGWGWSLFGLAWGFTLVGITLKLFWIDAPKWLSTSIYLLMGWLIIIGVYPLVNTLDPGALIWLAVGGFSYTIGAVIYAVDKPNPVRWFGAHEIFHIFVLLGSLSHFWVMYRYISLY